MRNIVIFILMGLISPFVLLSLTSCGINEEPTGSFQTQEADSEDVEPVEANNEDQTDKWLYVSLCDIPGKVKQHSFLLTDIVSVEGHNMITYLVRDVHDHFGISKIVVYLDGDMVMYDNNNDPVIVDSDYSIRIKQ